MTNVTHKFLSIYLFLFITLYMFRTHRAHHQERQIVSIQPLVYITLCRWPGRVQVGSELPAYTRHRHRQPPEVVLTQFVSPDDEHDVLDTCRELKGKKVKVALWGFFKTAAVRPIVFLPPTSSRIHFQRRHASYRCSRPLPAKVGTITNEFC